MNAFWRKGAGLALLFLIGEGESFGQADLSRYEIGLTAGAFVYQGDLTPSAPGSYRTLRPVVNLFVNRTMSPSLSLRTSLFYGGLHGNDAAYHLPAWRQQRNLNFHATALELSELIVWNVANKDRKLTPYVFAGAGLSFLKIRRDWSRFNGEFFSSEDLASRLALDIAHKTPKTIPVVPIGAGFRYTVTPKISVIGETSYRLTRTDYLDGFSKAGNPDLYDHYQSHTVGVQYAFGKRSTLDCPTTIR